MVKERVISSWFLALAALLEAGTSFLLALLTITGHELPLQALLLLSGCAFLVPILIAAVRGEFHPCRAACPPRVLVLSALMGIALIPPATALALLAAPVSGDAVAGALSAFAGLSPAEVMLYFGIAAPALEELFFRGLVLGRYAPAGTATAMIASAILFGLFHMNISQLSYGFFLGLVFAWLVLMNQSIFPALAAHMAFNTTEILILFLPAMEEHLPYLCVGSLFVLAVTTFKDPNLHGIPITEPEEGVTIISPSLTITSAVLIIFLILQAMVI